MYILRIRDGNGRKWAVWVPDTDGSGNDSLQVPDLSGISVPGLALDSTWTFELESWFAAIPGAGSEDLVMEDLFRYYITFTRTKPFDCNVRR